MSQPTNDDNNNIELPQDLTDQHIDTGPQETHLEEIHLDDRVSKSSTQHELWDSHSESHLNIQNGINVLDPAILGIPEYRTLSHEGRPMCRVSKHKSQCNSAPGSFKSKKDKLNGNTLDSTVILTEPLIVNNSIITLESVIPLPPLKAHELAVLATPFRYQLIKSAKHDSLSNRHSKISLANGHVTRTGHHNQSWFTPKIILLFVTLGILIVMLVIVIPVVWSIGKYAMLSCKQNTSARRHIL